jgi:hypothetical protein
MRNKTRRTLEELLARYELHPEMCDVYVEGDSDKDMLRWFFDSSGNRNIVVYPITEIEITHDRLDKEKLVNSNRGRVMLLATYIEKELGQTPKVTCVIDADLDYVLEVPAPTGLLVRTDFSSIELYAYDDAAVLKVARLLGCDLDKTGAEVLNDVSAFLQRLFFHRLVNYVLDLKLQWIDAYKCCALKNSGIEFDEATFRGRYLNKAGVRREDRKAFEEELRKYDRMKARDIRFVIRGHDFVEALAWYFSHHISRPPHPDAKLIRRMLFACIPLEQLAKFDLFASLLRRTAACGQNR